MGGTAPHSYSSWVSNGEVMVKGDAGGRNGGMEVMGGRNGEVGKK